MPIATKHIPELTEANKRNFWKFVEKSSETDCWNWKGSQVTKKGYGRFVYRTGKWVSAHRLTFFLKSGIDPHGLMVCHRCDNPRCCNPDHLFLGNGKDNYLDMVHKGRAKEGCFKVKLSRDEVIRMRKVYSLGGIKISHIGPMFGVCVSTGTRIVTGKRRSNI